MKWEPIEFFENDGKPVDLWVPDASFANGGQRFTDMTYQEGGPCERNDWSGDMLYLSDCGYSPEDVSHFLRVPAPAAGE